MLALAPAAKEASLRSRCDVLIKMRHIIGEIELGAAGINNGQRPAMVMHLENARDRAGGVARRQIDCDASVAHCDFHPVRGDDIALWLAGRIPVDRLRDHIPIVHHNTRTIARLEQKGAANLASVTMGNDDVLYLRGIKAELFDPSDQYILGVIDTLGVVED